MDTPATNFRARPALYAVCGGFFLVLMDATAVNVAVARLGRDLGASVGGLSWVLNGYTLVLAACLLVCGALGDRVGAKRLYLAGLALFSLAALACALAPDTGFLVAARMMQGLGAAMMIPASLSLLKHDFSGPDDLARAVGFWAGTASLGFALGPLLGGALVHAFGWRGVFWLEAPLGALTLWAARRFTREARTSSFRPLDWAGQAALLLALSCLTFALIQAGSWGWASPGILAAFGLASAFGALFLWNERRSLAPALPAALFRRPRFAVCVTVGAGANFALYGILFIESLRLQDVRHVGVFRTGLVIAPFTLLPTFVIRLLARYDGLEHLKARLMAGVCLGAAGALVLGLSLARAGLGAALLGFGLLGLGLGCIMPAMTAGVLASAPAAESGTAAALLNAFRQTGSTLGVALMGCLVEKAPATGMAWALALATALFLALAGLVWSGLPARTAEIYSRVEA